MKNKGILISIVILAAFFALWEFAARRGLIDTQFVPAFSTVISEAGELLKDNALFVHIASSLGRLFAGLGLALVTGLPLGFFLSGWTPRLTAFISPLLNNLSLVNPFALIPVFITVLGIGEVSKIGIIYWVLVWPVIFATVAGVSAIDPAIIDVARSVGARGPKIFFDIIIPAAIHRIFAGLKTSLTLGFLVLLSAEMVGAETGLGWLVFNSQKNYNIPRLYVGVLMVAIIGFVISLLIDHLQKVIVVWEPEA
jgi:NitT/TauT family transport system permease protein